MSGSPERSEPEAELLKQLADIDRQIVELQHEKLALQRLIARVRLGQRPLREVTRKNSFERILIEERIKEVLSEAGKPLLLSQIMARTQASTRGIKATTFRSYMHRLKERGIIASAGHGSWKIAPSS